MQETNLPSVDAFAMNAVGAYGTAFSTLFAQVQKEQTRMERINTALDVVTERLFDPEVLSQLSPEEQVVLSTTMLQHHRSTTDTLIKIASIIKNVHQIVGVYGQIAQARPELEKPGRLLEG